VYRSVIAQVDWYDFLSCTISSYPRLSQKSIYSDMIRGDFQRTIRQKMDLLIRQTYYED